MCGTNADISDHIPHTAVVSASVTGEMKHELLWYCQTLSSLYDIVGYLIIYITRLLHQAQLLLGSRYKRVKTRQKNLHVGFFAVHINCVRAYPSANAKSFLIPETKPQSSSADLTTGETQGEFFRRIESQLLILITTESVRMSLL